MPPLRLALCLLILLPATARAQTDGDRVWGDVAIRARFILRKYCAECHGEKPTRTQLSLLDHQQIVILIGDAEGDGLVGLDRGHRGCPFDVTGHAA